MLIQGHRYARYFVLAWAAVLLGTSALGLSKWGLLPWNLITANGAQIGAVFEVVLLSFALGDRMNFERATRAGDMLARFGGEEFIALLSNTDVDGAVTVAERLREAVEGLDLVFEGRRVHVTVSQGVAGETPSDLNDPENLILRADEALYAAKGLGRNRVCRYWKNSPSTQS